MTARSGFPLWSADCAGSASCTGRPNGIKRVSAGTWSRAARRAPRQASGGASTNCHARQLGEGTGGSGCLVVVSARGVMSASSSGSGEAREGRPPAGRGSAPRWGMGFGGGARLREANPNPAGFGPKPVGAKSGGRRGSREWVWWRSVGNWRSRRAGGANQEMEEVSRWAAGTG